MAGAIFWQVDATAGAVADDWGGRGDSDDWDDGGAGADGDGNDGNGRADDHAPSNFHN